MAKLILNVCDNCGDKDRPVKNYRIVSEGRTKELDLCDEHGAPIEKFMEGTRPRGGARGGRGRGNRVATLDQVEEAKQTA